MEKTVLTILTPTYNRVEFLPVLYESLKKQTNNDFEWIVIDDGSDDNTSTYMQSINESKFPVYYYYKENGGKHTALNFAHPYINGEIVCIVDSDDRLTIDAVDTILTEWKQYEYDEHIGIISYQKGRDYDSPISESIGEPDVYIDDDIHFLVNKGVNGDRCEVIRTSLLRAYPFPVFNGETFMSEGWLWNHIAVNYKTVYRRLVIYKCEYLEGGLTKSGRKIRLLSPRGMMENCKSFFVEDVSFKIKLKELLLFCVYALTSKLTVREVLRISECPIRVVLMMPIGFFIYVYWSRKYLK